MTSTQLTLILRKLRYIFFIVAAVYRPSIPLQAQMSFQFMPALHGQSVNGLFMAELQNRYAAEYQGRIVVTVSDAANKTVLRVYTPAIRVKPGSNPLSNLVLRSRIQFGNSAVAAIAAQTGKFPEQQ
jgi:hypothetical protein